MSKLSLLTRAGNVLSKEIGGAAKRLENMSLAKPASVKLVPKAIKIDAPVVIHPTKQISRYEPYLTDSYPEINPITGVFTHTGSVGPKNITIMSMPNDRGNLRFMVDGNFYKGARKTPREEVVNELQQMHNNYMETLPPIGKELYIHKDVAPDVSRAMSGYDYLVKLQEADPYISPSFTTAVKQHTANDVANFYMSPQYQQRFNERVGAIIPVDEVAGKWNMFKRDLNALQNEYLASPVIDRAELHGNSHILADDAGYVMSLNAAPEKLDYSHLLYTPTHEFGHFMYGSAKPGFASIKEANAKLIGDPKTQLLEDVPADNPAVIIMSDHDELRQRMIPAVKEMFQNKWTPEQAFEKSKALKLGEVNRVFKKPYIISLLGGLLGTVPVISTINSEE